MLAAAAEFGPSHEDRPDDSLQNRDRQVPRSIYSSEFRQPVGRASRLVFAVFGPVIQLASFRALVVVQLFRHYDEFGIGFQPELAGVLPQPLDVFGDAQSERYVQQLPQPKRDYEHERAYGDDSD